MRWLPTAAVVAAPIGCIVAAISPSGGYAEILGQMAVRLCVVSTPIFALMQPRPLNATLNDSLDEREIGLRWKAYARGWGVTCLLGMLFCFYMTWASGHGWKQPSPADWQNLFFLVTCWMFGMPMAFANWMVGKPLDDEDDQ